MADERHTSRGKFAAFVNVWKTERGQDTSLH
ncbi:MAG: hypothetical protein LZF62_410177 [Nitrospira sp.]|nr:MAG: hypothetical protein LZF62_410177 [Nitrospira sp.]